MLFFQIIFGFVPDYMHCILLGVCRMLSNLLMENKDISFYKKCIKNIKFPYQICRMTRPLGYNKYWKAREWENFLLYVSLPLLSKTLSKEKLEYLCLLVDGVYTLLKTSITVDELDEVDEKFHRFVALTEKYFGSKRMTFNLHQLLHVCKSVKDWGPIWAHSAFAFESANHELLQAIHCGKGVILQILWYINFNHSISVIQKKVFSDENKVAEAYCSNTFKPRVKKSLKVSNFTYFGKGRELSEDLRNEHNLPRSTRTYRRMVKDGCTYMSCLKINDRSGNSKA